MSFWAAKKVENPIIITINGKSIDPIPPKSLLNISVTIIGRVPKTSAARYLPMNSPIITELAMSSVQTAIVKIVSYFLSSES